MTEPDLSDFLDPPGPRPCKMGVYLDHLGSPEGDPTKFINVTGALAKKDELTGRFKVSNGRIARVLTEWGYSVSVFTVRAHRMNECGCAV